jgi:hypothetical protein
MTELPFAAEVSRDLVVVSGPDATAFLQSLVSQDLAPVAVGEATHALLLQPQGKLLVDFRAARVGPDEWWCVCEGGFGPALAGGLGRFRIRVAVDVAERPVAALAVRGQAPPADRHGTVAIPVTWGGAPAFDAVGDPAAVERLRAALGLRAAAAPEYERSRILAGVPKLGADVDERTIPQEAGLEREAVSFTKGCFVGQELVCRIDTRGHVNRLLRRLVARAGEPDLAPGAGVVVGGREVGRVTSAAGDVALAMVRREIAPGTEVVAGATRAVVETAGSG